jgi:hypothetical protein
MRPCMRAFDECEDVRVDIASALFDDQVGPAQLEERPGYRYASDRRDTPTAHVVLEMTAEQDCRINDLKKKERDCAAAGATRYS